MRRGQALYLHEDAAGLASYAAFDAQGRVLRRAARVPLAEIRSDGTPLVVLLPGCEVLLSRIALPAKNRQRVWQAAPYALEEHLTEEVDKLHCVPGEREAGGQYPVAVIAHARLREILARLADAGLRPDYLLPATLALPLPENGWSLLALDGLALARTGPCSGFAVERTTLPEFFSLALAEQHAARPECLWLLHNEEEAGPLLSEAQAQGVELSAPNLAGDALGWFARSLAQGKNPAAMNLLQGAFRRDDPLARLWRPWRLSAALLLAWLAALAGGEWQQARELEARRQALQGRIEAAYREAFPETRHLVNPKVQMERELQTLRAARAGPAQNDGLLEILARLAGPLGQAEGLLLKRLEYRQPRLDLELELPSLQVWESLRQALLAQQLEVDMQYSNSRDNRLETRLRIQPNASASSARESP